MNLKKILYITHQLTRTGAPNVLLDMILCSKSEGNAVAVISLSDGPAKTEWESAGIDVIIMPGLALMGEQMVPIMRGFDVIVVNTLVCCDVIPLCVESGVYTIWWIHEHENYFAYYKGRLPQWDQIKRNVRVYGVSPVTNRLITGMAGYNAAGLLPFCVPDRIDDFQAKKHVGMRDKVSFVCVGLFAYVKGQDILCKAISGLPSEIKERIEISFYGDLTEVDEAVYLPAMELTKNSDNVHVMPSVPHDKMLEIIADSDYIVIPSRKEPMPTVAVEAMMLNTPCILSDICGVTDFLENGINALFFSSGSVENLQSRIVEAVDIAGTEKYERLAQNARLVYESEFGRESFAKRLIEILSAS